MLYVTGEVGVGGGIISEGRLLRGSGGYSGEIGHMPLDPGGRPCVCGRRGCWETMVGLSALLRQVADESDPVHDPSLDLETRLADVAARAAAGDARTLTVLATVADDLALGFAAPSRGGAYLALDRLYQDPNGVAAGRAAAPTG
jgi:predicted NBD/HSP70 family sugar kinase